jgi:hypothetical protein
MSSEKCYTHIKIFSNLPSSIKCHMNEKAKFKVSLKRYLNLTNLTVHQKGPHCYGIKLSSCLPLKIKELVHDIKIFRVALNAFLHSNPFILWTNILVIWMSSKLLCSLNIACIVWLWSDIRDLTITVGHSRALHW